MFLLSLGTYLGYYSLKFGIDAPPSSTGDEPSYDSLGWELSHGNGFSVNYDDPEFRRPYDLAAKDSPELFTLSHDIRGPIAFRPPLFPVLIGATNIVFGRQHWMIRVLNALAMSVTCGLVSHYLFKRFGIVAALLGAGTFVVLDYRTRLYGRAILTEALACLLVALLVLAVQKSSNSRRLRWVVIAGVLAGLCTLTRTMLALWLPGIALTLIATSRRGHRGTYAPRLMRAAAFCAVALTVASPWMVRNVYVLGSFKPLGTQGLMEMSAGYSDRAFEEGGVWFNLGETTFYNGIVADDMTLLEAEVARANHSRTHARKWVRDNPGKAILLVPMKIINEFRPRESSEFAVLCLAIIGLTQLARFRDGRVLVGMLI
ncbi:MAG: glycosyltransferase family 39 protein, partial [Planctomycetia bacterium]|nr:glycosyltransferase family 39 protein [Planctomycetia bacterium]